MEEEKKPICCISGQGTHRIYRGQPYHRDVMELAKLYRDTKVIKIGTLKKKPSLDGIYMAMREMKKLGKSWEEIKFNMERRMKNENNSIDAGTIIPIGMREQESNEEL